MITSSFAILSVLSLVVVTPVVAFFLVRDWHEMLAWIDADLGAGVVRPMLVRWVPPERSGYWQSAP
jgi:predicted PurR-regulated permease PerM